MTPGERLPILHTILKGSGQGCPQPRASNDHRSSIFSLEGGLEGLPLRVYNEGLPILCTSLWRSDQGCPLLRAWDEHSFIVRVLRARRAPGHSFPSFQARSFFLSKGGLDWSPTAHVERPQLHRGRSLSTGDQPGYPYFHPSLLVPPPNPPKFPPNPPWPVPQYSPF